MTTCRWKAVGLVLAGAALLALPGRGQATPQAGVGDEVRAALREVLREVQGLYRRCDAALRERRSETATGTCRDALEKCRLARQQADGLGEDPTRPALVAALAEYERNLSSVFAANSRPAPSSSSPGVLVGDGSHAVVAVTAARITVSETIRFRSGSTGWMAGSVKVLGTIAGVLEANPSIRKVRIEGHADNRESPGGRQALSERRARAVRDWLARHGIDAARLVAIGFAEERPVADPGTREGRAWNRRVEFVVVDMAQEAPPPPKPADGLPAVPDLDPLVPPDPAPQTTDTGMNPASAPGIGSTPAPCGLMGAFRG